MKKRFNKSVALILVLSFLVLWGCAPQQKPLPEEGSSFSVHFIDVGQADAALILCDGKAMMIDGGNSEDSNLIYSYLSKRQITHLDYMVATHPHEDHIGGLAGALNAATVGTVYCPVTEYDSGVFRNFKKYVEKQGAAITVPRKGDTFELGNAVCTVIAVDPDAEDTNNTSIVLRIEYGKTSFLFTADAERAVELELVDSRYKLESTVLKVGHHGSDTSTSYVFLREIMPEYAVISVGADNDYGHPTGEVLSRLRDADVKVIRTDRHGTVVCTSDGKTVSFQTEKYSGDVLGVTGESDAETKDDGIDYVLNTKESSMKFHYPDCSAVEKMSQKNRRDYHGTRDELIKQGYTPCGICKP